ncbi:HNH endonuclease [Agrobacterium tumefaciens]|uniref:HNH endonuclease n=1 Tax=Agrobacterium tumefaciens TaxID=358 RepID=UPI0021CEE63D|nr:HNH endonuclease [Agrobacterium tumefaciens]UXS01649.1 HNH endonuclease [Agrobacterium tumefaciens]
MNYATMPWHAVRPMVQEAVLRKTGGLCYYCGVNFGEKYHIDHAIPSSRGGSNRLENLVPSCAQCNSEKSDKTIDEWRYQKTIMRLTAQGVAPHFTVKQISWLIHHNFNIFDGVDLHEFWYETEAANDNQQYNQEAS